MTRHYRNRRYRRKNDERVNVLSLFALLIILYASTGLRDFTNTHPYGLALIIAVTSLVILLAAGAAIYFMQRKRHIYNAITVADVDTMDGLEFERYLADLLRKRGYTDIKLTEKYDLGVDIIAKKDGVTWGIQAKCYSRPVRAEAVRQVHTALNRYKCNKAMVITNSTYTNPAQILAKDNNVILIERTILSEWIYAANRADDKQLSL